MPFRAVTIPLMKGMDSSSADLSATSQAQSLLAASNVVFTKTGGIKGRPGAVSQDGSVVMYDGSAGGGSLSNALSLYQSGALHTMGRVGGPDVLYQLHGRLLRKTTSEWTDAGPCWSVKRTTYSALRAKVGDQTTVAALDMGTGFGDGLAGQIVSYGPLLTTQTHGFGVYAPDGTIRGSLNPAVALPDNYVDNTNTWNAASVANKMVTWAGDNNGIVTDLGKVFVQIATTYPTAAQFTVATDAWLTAFSRTTAQRVWAAWDGTNYYVAYLLDAGGVKILKINTSGSVTASLTYGAGGNAVNSVSLAVDSATGKGHMVMTCAAGAQTRSRMFTLSTMADLAINVDVAGGTLGACAGIIGGLGYIAACTDITTGTGNSSVLIFSRSLSAATSTQLYVYTGGSNFTPFSCHGFQTLFPFQSLAGRVVMGIQTTNSGNSAVAQYGPWTWAVVDVTPGQLCPAPVAAGPTGGAVRAMRCSSACVLADGSLLFGASEGVTFGNVAPTFAGTATVTLPFTDIETCVMVPIKITPQGAPSCQVDNQLLLGGNVSYLYDGRTCSEAGWIEGAPTLSVSASGAGSLTAGASYTYAAVWVYTDASGRVTRSNPSPLFTLSTGVATRCLVNVSTPQITAKNAQYPSALYVEIYQSAANPSTQAPLYLMSKQQVTFGTSPPNQGALVGVAMMLQTVTTNQELYTTGNVLEDDRAPADRGLVVIGNRVWCADEHTLYPSHAVSNSISPAWNLEDYVISVPDTFGRVLGLGAMDDKAVAICENGVVVVNGPGLDNQGEGPGWSEPERVFNVGGVARPRSVASIPQGVAWIGPDGLPYLLSRAQGGSCVGSPVQGNAETICDIVYVPPAANMGWDAVSHALLIYGTANLKVLDLETGQWNLWTGATANSLCGTAAGLWISTTASPYVQAFTASGGQDLGVNFTMSAKTAPQETTRDGLKQGWGRVRSINPVFDTLGNHSLHLVVAADEGRVTIMDKQQSMTTTALGTRWPFTRLPEFRTSIQRAGFVEVTMTATPAATEWTALELWVSGAEDRLPSRTRVSALIAPPAFKAAGSLITDTGTGLTVPWPAHAAGDVALLIAFQQGNPPSVEVLTSPQGFVFVGQVNATLTSFQGQLTIWLATASSGAMGSPIIATSTTPGSTVAQIVTYTGCGPVPVDVLSSGSSSALGAAGDLLSVPGNTSTRNNDLLVMIGGHFTDAPVDAISVPLANASVVGLATRSFLSNGLPAIGGQAGSILVGDGVLSVAGAYGTTTATYVNGGGFDSVTGFAIALKNV